MDDGMEKSLGMCCIKHTIHILIFGSLAPLPRAFPVQRSVWEKMGEWEKWSVPATPLSCPAPITLMQQGPNPHAEQGLE
jgi:hypothetical protein